MEDIRRKTQSSIDLCMEQGDFIAPRAPYSYQKSTDNCHHLIVDPVAADVVRHIFIMADQQEGLTCLEIYIRESAVMSAIRAEISNIIKSQQQIMSCKRKEQRYLECENSQIEQDNRIQSIERRKIYEDMVMGKLTKEEAISLKIALPDFSDELLQRKSNLEQIRIKLEQFQTFCNAEKEQATFKKLLSRYLLKVTVFTDKNMVIEFDMK